MNGKELNYKESWAGEYRGVRFEVVHWRLGWNYYLDIPIDQLPNDAINQVFNLHLKLLTHSNGKHDYYYDYSGASIISDLDWHCGITLYEKIRNSSGNPIGYHLGCDYMHYWDECHTYSLQGVQHDAKHSIDKLWEQIPDLKIRCAYNGKYYAENETFLTDKGVRVAIVNKEAWYRPI
jgi:hypothetical protein